MILILIYIYETVFFLGQCCRFICHFTFFLSHNPSKTLSFFTIFFLLILLISLKFPSCCLPQANILQHFSCFSIRNIRVQKPKLISIHISIVLVLEEPEALHSDLYPFEIVWYEQTKLLANLQFKNHTRNINALTIEKSYTKPQHQHSCD